MSGKAVRETLGFLAVVAGLVFVGIEIRQNTAAQEAQAAAQRAQTRQALADAGSTFNLALTDPQLSRQLLELWSLGQDEGGDCLGIHAVGCNFVFALLRYHENLFFQVGEGFVDESVFDSYGWRFNPTYSAPFFPQWWPSRRNRFDPDFVAAFEAEYDLAP